MKRIVLLLTCLVTPLVWAAVDVRDIDFEPRLGETISTDLPFRDEAGQMVRLGQLLEGKPAILVLAYYRCPKLCGLVLDELATGLAAAGLEPGTTLQVVVAGIDPRETPAMAAAKKLELAARHPKAGIEVGWHFLTGEETVIGQLAKNLGFRFTYDPDADQVVHPAGIVWLTGAGRIARYLDGVRFASTDLSEGLTEAAANRVGSPAERLLLLCYDTVSGRYGMPVMWALRLTGLVTLTMLGGGLLILRRREKRCHTPASAGPRP